MGNEARGRVELGDAAADDAKALLETEELIVRGPLRARMPFRELTSVTASDGILSFEWNRKPVRLHVGKDAAKWAEKIRNPRTLLDKLGIRADSRVSLEGDFPPDFVASLGSRLAPPPADLVFLAAPSRAALARLAELAESLAPGGALWVVRPKGSPEITELDVLDAGRAAGLVDVKVVKFSEELTGEKFVRRK